jgi:GxxExxY protein
MEKKTYSLDSYPLQVETDLIIKTGIEIHKLLGAGFLEIVYKDAYEYEFRNKPILYEREKEYQINYKYTVLPHRFYADFVVFDKLYSRSRPKKAVLPKKIMLKQ